MTKENIAKKIKVSLNKKSDLFYSYIGGSFNTPFFDSTSDIDLILIWTELPNQSKRSEVMSDIEYTFKCHLEWAFLDTNDSSPRDAIKLTGTQKIEIYHYDIEGFQDLLAHQNEFDGLSFSIANRLPLTESIAMDSFILSYNLDSSNAKEQLYFQVASSIDLQEQSKDVINKIIQLYSLSLYKSIPSRKHYPKLLNSLPSSNLLKENNVSEWLKEFRYLLQLWSNLSPSETLMESEDFYLNKHSPALSEVVFNKVQEQKERLQQYLSWPRHINSLEDQMSFSRKADQQWDAGKAYHFQIFYKDSFAGAISVHSLDFKERSFEFGYWVDEAFEGKGLLTRGLKLLLKEMSEKGWISAKIRSSANNHRSRKVAEKLAMQLIGSNKDFVTYSQALNI